MKKIFNKITDSLVKFVVLDDDLEKDKLAFEKGDAEKWRAIALEKQKENTELSRNFKTLSLRYHDLKVFADCQSQILADRGAK